MRLRSHRRSHGRGRERGIALLTALLLVALATIAAAAIAFNNAMTARRGAAAFAFDTGLQWVHGAEAMAAYALTADATNSTTQTDDFTRAWATVIPPFVVDDVTIEPRIEDLAGRFNLNDLVDGQGADDPDAIAQLQRIFRIVGVEDNWASLIADWIDPDTNPLPDGGEDSLYLSQNPPYRPPNMPITSVSELLALPGFGRERYLKVAPYLTALPRATPLNVCTASGVVLDSLFLTERNFSGDPTILAKSRANANGCFPTVTQIQSYMQGDSPTQFTKVSFRIGMKSDYYELHSLISIGTAEFTLYSLLHRVSTGPTGYKVNVVSRSYGTE